MNSLKVVIEVGAPLRTTATVARVGGADNGSEEDGMSLGPLLVVETECVVLVLVVLVDDVLVERLM